MLQDNQLYRFIALEDEIDISRGDNIVHSNNKPGNQQDFEVMLCWLHTDPAIPRAKYTIKHTSNEQKAMIKEVVYKIDINTFDLSSDSTELSMNDLCKVRLRTTKPLMADSCQKNRTTESLILIDDTTNETVTAGIIV